MFTIEKPKEIHLNSWKDIINESASSNSFQFDKVNFSLFWQSIFQDDYFAFAAKNEDKFILYLDNMADPNKNGENYDKKNRWVWIVIVLITLSSIYVMSKIFIQTPWQYLQ